MKIQCKICLDIFPNHVNCDECPLGSDCNAWIYEDLGKKLKLEAGYGSSYDYEVYEFTDWIDFLLDKNPVCDGCIKTFLEQGVLLKVSDV